MLFRKSATLLTALTVLAGCKIETTVPTVKITNKNPLTCSAMLASSAGSSVVSGQAAPIEVKATGGAAPYQILNTAIGFSSETVISRTYTNNTNSNLIEVDTVSVTDSGGEVTQCNFQITVAPAGSTPSLSCTLVASPATPAINANVGFVATAAGGSGAYTFSQFALGTDGTIVTPFATTSATQGSATGKYSTSGLRTASITVSDSSSTVSCSTSVNVAPAPSVSAVFSPASSVVVGNAITLTATAANFSGTPTYSFATTRSGVQISSTGNVATVTSSSVQSAFDVVVTATSGSQTATYTVVGLSFTAAGSLGCSLVVPSGILYTNQNVLISVVPTSPATDPLEITYFATQSDAVTVATTDSTRTVKYPVAGVKTILVQAKSKTTGALCQAGATLSSTIEITPGSSGTLSCTGYTSINPSNPHEYFYAWATITGGTGSTKVNTLTITPVNAWENSANAGYWVNANTAYMTFFYTGSFRIRFNISDSAGNTGSCTTTQVVW